MSVKVRKLNKKQKAVLSAINKYGYSNNTQMLSESLIQEAGYLKINKPLTESAVKSKRTRDMLCISTNRPRVVLYENSAYDTPTLDSFEVIERVLKSAEMTSNQVYAHTHYDDQTVADYIVYYIPKQIGDELINKKYEIINKIMTACGYFLSIEPEITNSGFGEEYTIQYEPNEPDCRKVILPNELHHLTTVLNSEDIKEHGFTPKSNDIYKYKDRIYFIDYPDDRLVMHLVRRHKNKLIKPGTTNTLEYADIIIETPRDIKFYYDYHMKNVESFFTFDAIDKKYIKSIEIKEVGSMMKLMKL